jgi:hypothetical protein
MQKNELRIAITILTEQTKNYYQISITEGKRTEAKKQKF